MLVSIPTTYVLLDVLARDFNRRYNLETGSVEILEFTTREMLRFSLYAGAISLCMVTLPWAVAAGFARLRSERGDRQVADGG